MRAIIIEEVRFAEIIELMRSKVKNTAESTTLKYILQKYGLTESDINSISDSITRTIMLPFIQWAQDQGASCVR